MWFVQLLASFVVFVNFVNGCLKLPTARFGSNWTTPVNPCVVATFAKRRRFAQ